MTWAAVLAIVGMITAVFKGLPLISSWFTKTDQQKRDEIDEKNQAEKDRVSKGGRPS
jgi:hypothetical protein